MSRWIATIYFVLTLSFVGCTEDNENNGSDSPAVDADAGHSKDSEDNGKKDAGSSGNEVVPFPPLNPFVANSPWPMSHQNPYAQASSPLPGPTADSVSSAELVNTMLSITLAYSEPDENENYTIWGSGILGQIFKIKSAQSQYEVVDSLQRESSAVGTVGAYSVIDQDGTFFVPHQSGIEAYTDQVAGDLDSPIATVDRLDFAEGEIQGGIVGINMTYDGWIAFATKQGTVGVVSRDLKEYKLLSLEDGGTVSNSIAVDEDGGIYVVSSKKMHRVQWTGTEVTLDPALGAWSADYDVGEGQASGRLGEGSGATPSLMGTLDQDKFVVITDGRELMHLVLLWRETVPEDWEPIAPGKDIRIAAEIPVTFGDPSATSSVSEQSVLVYGYSAVVVNNDYGKDAPAGAAAVLAGYVAYGVEKFTWDASTRTLKTAWANPDIPCPNGIPTMSAATELIYCIGKRDQTWTLEGIDWHTGASAFTQVIGDGLPYNSTYAATEIGVEGTITTGVSGGMVVVK